MLYDLLWIFVLCAIGFLWWHDRGIKQNARKMATRLCKQHQVQLLDDHARLTKMTINWSNGALKIERHFAFEFSYNRDDRYQGVLIFLGSRCQHVHMPIPKEETVN